jgi:hypothetical protein
MAAPQKLVFPDHQFLMRMFSPEGVEPHLPGPL